LFVYGCATSAVQAALLLDGHAVDTGLVQAGSTLAADGGTRQVASPILFARSPLEAGRQYTASFRGLCDGGQFSATWSFSTST